MERDNSKKEVTDMLVLIIQISITMLVPILMCTIGGAWLDQKFHTKYLGLIGFVLGAVAGFQNVYRLVKKYLVDQKSPGQIKRQLDEQAKREHEDIKETK